jgi:hypothetical protein
MNQQDRQGNIAVHSYNNFPVAIQQYLLCVLELHSGWLCISNFNCCNSSSSDLRLWPSFMQGCATESLHTLINYIIDCKATALVCDLLLWMQNRKKRKKFWVHPIMSQRLLKGKFYSLYKNLKTHPQKFFWYFRISSRFD